jgi:hypothetical protein
MQYRISFREEAGRIIDNHCVDLDKMGIIIDYLESRLIILYGIIDYINILRLQLHTHSTFSLHRTYAWDTSKSSNYNKRNDDYNKHQKILCGCLSPPH